MLPWLENLLAEARFATNCAFSVNVSCPTKFEYGNYIKLVVHFRLHLSNVGF